jgi:hypothetical protein
VALRKKKSYGIGLARCLIATIAVMLFVSPEIVSEVNDGMLFWPIYILAFLIFWSHALLDLTPVVDKCLSFIRGRKCTDGFVQMASHVTHVTFLCGIFKFWFWWLNV